jgi:hypothetical protein
MRLLLGLVIATIGVLLVVISPLLALAGGVWDAMALALGDVITGPQFADQVPAAAFLLGMPLGVVLVIAGWRLGRSTSSHGSNQTRSS